MKKFLSLLSIACVMFLLSSCAIPMSLAAKYLKKDKVSAEATAPSSIVETEPSLVTEPVEVTAPWESTAAPTAPPVQITELSEPYYVTIGRNDFPIYSGPGYEFTTTATVEAAGIYTIIAEAVDGNGVLWGKLKSGAGWVDLDQVAAEQPAVTTVTAAYADEALLSGGYYYYCQAETESYYDVAFLSNVPLYDVTFFEFVSTPAGDFASKPELYHMSYWESGIPFVANIPLSSCWGLRFTDADGITQTYWLFEVTGGEEAYGDLYFEPYIWDYEPYEPPAEELSTPTIPPYLDLYFASGAGAWGTNMTLCSDGTFYGSFHDSNMGETGEGYPYGTCYISDFEGSFSRVDADAYSLLLQLDYLSATSPGLEYIENGLRYITADAYGISGGYEFILFMPSTPVELLPEDMYYWYYDIPQTGNLGCYALYCPELETVFFSN